MTIVAYIQDAIWSDRCVIHNVGTPYQRAALLPKQHVTDCGRVAFANSGPIIHPDNYNLYKNLMLALMTQIETHGHHRDWTGHKGISDLLRPSDRTWIIMTRRLTWTIGYHDNGSARFDNDGFVVHGTGMRMFEALANPGGKPLIPLEQVIPHIAGHVNTVSAEYDVIHRHQLKPFKILGKQKRTIEQILEEGFEQ